MKIISWNVHGLNGHSKQRMLKMKIQKENPPGIFLQETKCSSEVSTKLMSQIWKYYFTIAIDSRRSSGGISISWYPILVALNNVASSLHAI